MSIFILSGELSGDLHGSRLVRALKKLHPHQSIFGVAGPLMRKEGVESLLPMEDFQIMGFTDVIRSILSIRRQLKFLTEEILKRNPKVVVLIDYAGFNMRLARLLRRQGYRGKLIQYISPKVWAWKKKRMYRLAKDYDLLMCIFPFEVDVYEETSLWVEYIGNPLSEVLKEYPYQSDWKKGQSIDNEPILGLFPGSRKSEIALNLPRQLATAYALKKEIPNLKIMLSVAGPHRQALINKIIEKGSFTKEEIECIQSHERLDLMHHCTVALATSGTITLELAMHKVPTVVVYRLSTLNAFLAGCIFRIFLPFYCMVNISLQKEIFPELIHMRFRVSTAKKKLLEFLQCPSVKEKCHLGCEELIEQLSGKEPSLYGAELIGKIALN